MKGLFYVVSLCLVSSNLNAQIFVNFQNIFLDGTSTPVSLSQTNNYPSNCLLDFNITFSNSIENAIPDPYDYETAVLQVEVKNENGELVRTIDGFFKHHPDFSFKDSWHVRMSFAEEGVYDLDFRLRIDGVDVCFNCPTVPVNIENMAASCNDMPRLNFAANNYMETEDGDPFFSIGSFMEIGIGASSGSNEHHSSFANYNSYSSTATLTRYEQVVSEWSSFGGNTFKYQLNPVSSQYIEWDEVGNYSGTWERQNDLDAVVALSHEFNVYLILSFYTNSLLSDAWFRTNLVASPTLQDAYNPYRKLYHELFDEDIEDETYDLNEINWFFTSSDARKYQKRKIRYINARWGYSNTVIGYELHNEFNDSYSEDQYLDHGMLGKWVDELACYIKNDINPDKLVTVSSVHDPKGVYATNSDCVDFQYPHFGDILEFTQRNASYLKNMVTQFWLKRNKPTLAGDWGFAGPVGCQPVEITKNKMHHAIWSSSFTGAFGACYPFYHGSDIFSFGNQGWQLPNKGVYHFRPIYNFMLGENLNSGTWNPIANDPQWNSSKDDDFEHYNSGPDSWYYADVDQPWWLGNPTDESAWLKKEYLSDFTKLNNAPKVTTTNEEDIELFALKNTNRIIGWVHNKDYNWKNIPNPFDDDNGCLILDDSLQKFLQPNYDYADIPTIEGAQFTIYNLCDGEYEIEWWNTYSNKMDLAFHVDNFDVNTVSPWEGVDIDGDGIADDGGVFSSPSFQTYNQTVNASHGSASFKIPPLRRLNLEESNDFAPDYGFKVRKIDPTSSIEFPVGVENIVIEKSWQSQDPCAYDIYAYGGDGEEYIWNIYSSNPTTNITAGNVLNNVILLEDATLEICIQVRNECSISEPFCTTLPKCEKQIIFEFDIFPNPTSHMITIDKKGNTDLKFEIYSVYGSQLLGYLPTSINEREELNVTSFPDGAYIVIGKNNEGESFHKFFMKNATGEDGY